MYRGRSQLQDILDAFMTLGTCRTSPSKMQLQRFVDYFSWSTQDIRAIVMQALSKMNIRHPIQINWVGIHDHIFTILHLPEHRKMFQDLYEFHVKTSQATVIQKYFRRWMARQGVQMESKHHLGSLPSTEGSRGSTMGSLVNSLASPRTLRAS